MRLSDWLRKTNQSQTIFADMLGVDHETVGRYCRAERVPRREILNRISELTKGKVTRKDFVMHRLAKVEAGENL